MREPRQADRVVVARAEEIPPGSTRLFRVGKRAIAVANVAGAYYAFNARCPHRGGPLYQGMLLGHQIDCPWHHYVYDVRTGENVYPYNVYPPEMKKRYRRDLNPVRTYAVAAEDGLITVLIPRARRRTGASVERG